MSGAKPSRLFRALAGETLDPPPWWLMRQAGRYLPEYRGGAGKGRRLCRILPDPGAGGGGDAAAGPALRHGCGDPVRRYPAGAAGPRPARRLRREVRCLTGRGDGRSRSGFTPAGIVVPGSGVRDGAPGPRAALPGDGADRVRRRAVDGGDLHGRGRRQPGLSGRGESWAYRDPAGFAALLDLIGEATVSYLSGQIAAGVEAVQLFDSWAGVLPEREFERWVIAPTRQLVQRLKQSFPQFRSSVSRGARHSCTNATRPRPGSMRSAIDTIVPLDAARRLQPRLRSGQSRSGGAGGRRTPIGEAVGAIRSPRRGAVRVQPRPWGAAANAAGKRRRTGAPFVAPCGDGIGLRMTRRAVVLMNLGGPDLPAAVRPFLYNLFSDPAIIGLPAVLRLPLAWLIAARRSATAQQIYAQLGGASPLLANTEAQARALECDSAPEPVRHRCFIAMRYWHPLTAVSGVRGQAMVGRTRSCCCRSTRSTRRRRRHPPSMSGSERGKAAAP